MVRRHAKPAEVRRRFRGPHRPTPALSRFHRWRAAPARARSPGRSEVSTSNRAPGVVFVRFAVGDREERLPFELGLNRDPQPFGGPLRERGVAADAPPPRQRRGAACRVVASCANSPVSGLNIPSLNGRAVRGSASRSASRAATRVMCRTGLLTLQCTMSSVKATMSSVCTIPR